MKNHSKSSGDFNSTYWEFNKETILLDKNGKLFFDLFSQNLLSFMTTFKVISNKVIRWDSNIYVNESISIQKNIQSHEYLLRIIKDKCTKEHTLDMEKTFLNSIINTISMEELTQTCNNVSIIVTLEYINYLNNMRGLKKTNAEIEKDALKVFQDQLPSIIMYVFSEDGIIYNEFKKLFSLNNIIFNCLNDLKMNKMEGKQSYYNREEKESHENHKIINVYGSEYEALCLRYLFHIENAKQPISSFLVINDVNDCIRYKLNISDLPEIMIRKTYDVCYNNNAITSPFSYISDIHFDSTISYEEIKSVLSFFSPIGVSFYDQEKIDKLFHNYTFTVGKSQYVFSLINLNHNAIYLVGGPSKRAVVPKNIKFYISNSLNNNGINRDLIFTIFSEMIKTNTIPNDIKIQLFDSNYILRIESMQHENNIYLHEIDNVNPEYNHILYCMDPLQQTQRIESHFSIKTIILKFDLSLPAQNTIHLFKFMQEQLNKDPVKAVDIENTEIGIHKKGTWHLVRDSFNLEIRCTKNVL